MNLRRFVGLGAAVGLLVAASAAGASAAPVAAPAAAPKADVFQIAAQVTPDGADQTPAAIPAAVAAVVGAARVATVAVRGFTAARAPQQVAQVTRAASTPSALGLFGIAQAPSQAHTQLENAYFDR